MEPKISKTKIKKAYDDYRSLGHDDWEARRMVIDEVLSAEYHESYNAGELELDDTDSYFIIYTIWGLCD